MFRKRVKSNLTKEQKRSIYIDKLIRQVKEFGLPMKVGKNNVNIEFLFNNENDFICYYSFYEKDINNGRCYVLEESKNRHDENMSGALVKRRISQVEYDDKMIECLTKIMEYYWFLMDCGEIESINVL